LRVNNQNLTTMKYIKQERVPPQENNGKPARFEKQEKKTEPSAPNPTGERPYRGGGSNKLGAVNDNKRNQ